MFTYFTQLAVYNGLFGGAPGGIRIGLSLTKPDLNGGNVTTPGGNYAPVDITTSDFDINAVGSPGSYTDVYLSSNTDIDFPAPASIDWGSIPYWTMEFLVGPSTYVLLDWGYLVNATTQEPETQIINTGDSFSILSGNLIARIVLPPSES